MFWDISLESTCTIIEDTSTVSDNINTCTFEQEKIVRSVNMLFVCV